MTIDQNVKKKVKKFLEKYAQEHGQPDPSQKYARKIAVEVRSSGEIILLPTYASYRSVHHDFVISVGEESNLKSLKYEAFRYYETIEQNFLLARHSKSQVDSGFGMIKRRYKKSTVLSKEQFAEVVRKSSPAGLNKVQCYEEGKGFQYCDIEKDLEPYFKKLPKIGKYHHFFFESYNLGVIKFKEFVDSKWEEFDLLKTDGRKREKVIEEIRNLTFPILPPKSLSLKRQEYLYKEVRPLLPKEFRDMVFPRLNIGSQGML
ncbi:14534_t:CDS:2 [Cetraspora pellucida]|uniref:14534_t:CDS:1 n=1 Tax=Cetraspora pellucida TaxID=1433469 RepID=A0ACA9LKL4_9GLOM|nr:14534_t:CDS:2 [Cetraspora pellucida]